MTKSFVRFASSVVDQLAQEEGTGRDGSDVGQVLDIDYHIHHFPILLLLGLLFEFSYQPSRVNWQFHSPGVPPFLVTGIHAFIPIIPHESLVSKADVPADGQIPVGTSIWLDLVELQDLLHFNYKVNVELTGVLCSQGQSKIFGELAVVVDGVVLQYVDGYFSSSNGFGLIEVDNLHSGVGLRLDEDAHDQVPCFFQVLGANAHVKLPVRGLMGELILGVPVDAGLWRVELDEAIVAQAFILRRLGNCVAILLEEFIGELVGDRHLCLSLRVSWQFLLLLLLLLLLFL